MVAFSGHGFEQKDHSWLSRGIPKILLNDDEKDIDIARISPKRKGTLIVDACRGEVGFAESLSFSTNNFSAHGRAVASSEKNIFLGYQTHQWLQKEAIDSFTVSSESHGVDALRLHREHWLKEFQQCNKGIVTMQSCSLGENADEDTNEGEGGLYTTLLHHFARQWEKKTRSLSSYSTRDAHNEAKIYMQKNYPQQNPEYSPLDLHFPFAVKV